MPDKSSYDSTGNAQQSSVAYTYTTNGKHLSADPKRLWRNGDPDDGLHVCHDGCALPTLHMLDRVSQVLVKDGSGQHCGED